MSETPPPFDLDELADRCVDDAEFACKMLDLFVKQAIESLEGLEAAQAAQDVQVALRHTHTLKGTCANVSEKSATAQAIVLEKALENSWSEEALAAVRDLQCEVRRAIDAVPAASRELQEKFGY